jgi:hypothetical protein
MRSAPILPWPESRPHLRPGGRFASAVTTFPILTVAAVAALLKARARRNVLGACRRCAPAFSAPLAPPAKPAGTYADRAAAKFAVRR